MPDMLRGMTITVKSGGLQAPAGGWSYFPVILWYNSTIPTLMTSVRITGMASTHRCVNMSTPKRLHTARVRKTIPTPIAKQLAARYM
jgi:hypothetical protein